MISEVKILLWMFLFLMFFSCVERDNDKQENLKTIKIDVGDSRDYKLSEFVSEIRYVKLNTPDDVLSDGMVKIKNNHIYYWDFQQRFICVFDLNGKFITKLNKLGSGPGEYAMIHHFYVSDDEKSIEIWDLSGRKIIRYNNISFELIEEEEISQSINFTSGVKLEDDSYILSTNEARNIFNGKETNAEFFLCNKNGGLLKSYFDVQYKNESSKDYIQYTLFNFRSVQDELNKIYATVNFSDYIYFFEGLQFIPIAKVLYSGGKSINNDEMQKMSRKEQMYYFTQSGKFVQTASFPNLAINNSDLMVINYRFRDKVGGQMKLRHYIDFKKSNHVIHAKSIINDISGFPKMIQLSYSNSYDVHCNPWYKNQFVSIISPASELKTDASIILDSLGEVTALDNPVIMFMKLKD